VRTSEASRCRGPGHRSGKWSTHSRGARGKEKKLISMWVNSKIKRRNIKKARNLNRNKRLLQRVQKKRTLRPERIKKGKRENVVER